jgi:hypothetical protein
MKKDHKPNPRYNNEILAWEYDQRQPVPFTREGGHRGMGLYIID